MKPCCFIVPFHLTFCAKDFSMYRYKNVFYLNLNLFVCLFVVKSCGADRI